MYLLSQSTNYSTIAIMCYILKSCYTIISAIIHTKKNRNKIIIVTIDCLFTNTDRTMYGSQIELCMVLKTSGFSTGGTFHRSYIAIRKMHCVSHSSYSSTISCCLQSI